MGEGRQQHVHVISAHVRSVLNLELAYVIFARSALSIRDVPVGEGRQQHMHTISAGECSFAAAGAAAGVRRRRGVLLSATWTGSRSTSACTPSTCWAPACRVRAPLLLYTNPEPLNPITALRPARPPRRRHGAHSITTLAS